MARSPEDHVYFIQCEEFTKIGITRSMVRRLNDYKVHNPFPCKLIHSYKTPTAKRDEDLLHTAFESYHVTGEWFKLPLGLLQVIKSERLQAQAIVDKLLSK